jgi:hypothetical protein
MATRSILLPFCIFYGRLAFLWSFWYIFPFWYVVAKKSGNPGPTTEATLSSCHPSFFSSTFIQSLVMRETLTFFVALISVFGHKVILVIKNSQFYFTSLFDIFLIFWKLMGLEQILKYCLC